MFTIQLDNFFHRHVDHKKKLQAVGSISQEGFPLRNIKTRHKIKHSKMREKHLRKNVTHSWQVSTKQKQSKQEQNKLTRKKEGRHFLAMPHKVDSVLPALVVALCSKGSKCSDTNRMLCKRS